MGGIPARRAARAAAFRSARGLARRRPGRPDLERPDRASAAAGCASGAASSAFDDITERGSIAAEG
jgi:hypothetical protein